MFCVYYNFYIKITLVINVKVIKKTKIIIKKKLMCGK